MRSSLACLLGLAGVAQADTIQVPSQQPTIQAAIDIAVDGDDIVVAPGTYFETINLLGKAITVRSSGGAAQTVIDGQQGGSVIKCETSEGAMTVIDGFTVTGGTGTMFGVRTAGGGLLNFGAEPTVTNCIFRGNEADDGGAVYNFVGDPKYRNCVFFENDSLGFLYGGGAMYNNFSNPLVVNCTFASNDATDGGAIYSESGVPRLINCVIWSNTPNAFSGNMAPIVSYSNVQGDFSGTGNIEADPLFVSLATGDLRLQAGSACIDRGDSTSIAAEEFEDVAGDPRGVDDPASPDRGLAVFALNVDMGAYEFQVDAPQSCPGDVDGPDGVPDGQITFFDLLRILSGWGPCP